MAPRLVLWDVDGTLLRSSRLTRDVFDVAVQKALGRPPGGHGVVMSGKTDPRIALEILAVAGVTGEEARGHLPRVIQCLEEELAAAADTVRRDGKILPGVAEILPRLHAEPDVVQSVLTGNTAANAAVKLDAVGLDRWLDLEVGAYGSDDADREALVPVARRRAREHHGRDFSAEEVWVVGDTPGDLACARAGGTRCLLVGTGAFPLEQLEAAGPDHLLADLSDADAVCELLLS
ncbi:MAG TPA: haloacid dehalogenase-like hydrolase [Acidimicrobiales bacterium]|nr:haloacid dehalogenase-like hydrolase [Acidimicrobiales bacterium]